MTFYLYDSIDRKFIPLTGKLEIGRTDGDLLFPKDGFLSRLHCRVEIAGRLATIEDLDASNPTKVNATPLLPHKKRRLALNDVIECGRRRFVFSNQNTFAPGNLADGTHSSEVQFAAVEREDGSLTSHISGLIHKTRIILSRRAYNKLQVKEFTRMRGWDFSTVLVLTTLPLGWLAALVFLVDLGAFAPELRHPSTGLLARFLVLMLLSTLFCTLAHYLLIRRRFRSAIVRTLAVPFSWVMGALFLLPAELTSSIITDVAENTTEYACIRRFNAKLCPKLAEDDAVGFRKLPPSMKRRILETVALKTP